LWVLQQGATVIVNNNQNIKGNNINIGVNAVGGDASGHNINQTINVSDDFKKNIEKLVEVLKGQQNAEANEAALAVTEFAASPNTGKLQKALDAVNRWMAVGWLSAEVLVHAKEFAETAFRLLT
jgi:hypothetical protein